MARKMVWVKQSDGWGCSDCAWVFVPSGPPHGEIIDQMMRNFMAKRDKEFNSHACTKDSRTQAQELKLSKKI
jgi:Zn-finger protein